MSWLGKIFSLPKENREALIQQEANCFVSHLLNQDYSNTEIHEIICNVRLNFGNYIANDTARLKAEIDESAGKVAINNKIKANYE